MALVITRKDEQRIILTGTLEEGQEIVILTRKQGERLKLIFEAPDSIEILREELRDPGDPDDLT